MSDSIDLGYHKVFVSLDGSEQEADVLDHALKIAANTGASLVVGHVIDTSSFDSQDDVTEEFVEENKAKYLEALKKKFEENPITHQVKDIEAVVEAGRITDTLKDKMLDVIKPDLVVCGARGLSSIKYALLGSVSTFLLRHVDCNILVVK